MKIDKYKLLFGAACMIIFGAVYPNESQVAGGLVLMWIGFSIEGRK